MLAGGFTLLIMGLQEVGGWNELWDLKYPCSAPQNITADDNVNEECLYPPDTWNHIIRPADDGDFPWPGVIFGMVVGSVWYWCTDQVMNIILHFKINYTTDYDGMIISSPKRLPIRSFEIFFECAKDRLSEALGPNPRASNFAIVQYIYSVALEPNLPHGFMG